MRDINQIVIHCSATPPDMDVGRTEINEWHVQRGFGSIGYHVVIRRNGDIEAGRPIHQPGAHAKGHNANSIGICLVGGVERDGSAMVPTDNFTPQQYESLEIMVTGLCYAFSLDPKEAVLGHRDLPNVTKACPCFDVAEWMDYAGVEMR